MGELTLGADEFAEQKFGTKQSFGLVAQEVEALFPELVATDDPVAFHCGTLLNPIRVMHGEHDEVGELLATLHHRTNGYRPPADACPTWHALYAGLAALEHDVHTHVHLENNVLFPKILELEAAHR